MIKVLAQSTNNAEPLWTKTGGNLRANTSKTFALLCMRFFHVFNFSSFVICFNLVELILFWQNVKISIESVLKSSLKQNYRLLSKCRWPSTKQVLSTTEWYFENWIPLRRKKCQVNTTDTRLNQFIASWIIAHLVGNNWRSIAVLTDTSGNQVPSIKSGTCGSADITP